MRTPELLIFDFHDTILAPYDVPELPTRENAKIGWLSSKDNGTDQGITSIKCGFRENGEKVTLEPLPGVIETFQHLWLHHPDIKIAIASTAYTEFSERCTKEAIALFQVHRTVGFEDLFARNWPDRVVKAGQHLQIGRRPPLSTDKSKSHIPKIKDMSGIPYSQMIFFDDCLTRDHVTMVEENLPEVTCVRCPTGLTVEKLNEGLQKFDARCTNEN